FRGENKGLDVSQILNIAGVELEVLEGLNGSADDLFRALAFWREDDIADFLPLAQHAAAFVDVEHAGGLAVSVVTAGLPELRFLAGELLNDFVNLRLRRIGEIRGEHAEGTDQDGTQKKFTHTRLSTHSRTKRDGMGLRASQSTLS